MGEGEGRRGKKRKRGVWIRQWRGRKEKARRRARVGALLFPLEALRTVLPQIPLNSGGTRNFFSG